MRRALPLKHVVGAVGLAMVLVLTLVYLYSSVLGGSVGSRPVHVTVAMSETGGLFEGSGVAYRGVRIGKVERVDLAGDHVEASIRIDPGARVPADAAAVVRTLSPAGEQFLDLQPKRGRGPWLSEGDTITEARTSTPATVADTLRAVDRLMSQVDEKDLRTVLRELDLAFSDPEDLRSVVSSSSNLVATLDQTWPATLRTLQQGRTVLRTGVDTADDFRSFATSARSLTAWLKGYDGTLRGNLDVAPRQLDELQRLTADVVESVPALLRNLTGLTDILASRDPHLRELLIQFPKALQRLVDVFSNGRLSSNMIVDPGTSCSYGDFEDNPRDPVRRPVDPDRSCPPSYDGLQRGAAHAPGPTR